MKGSVARGAASERARHSDGRGFFIFCDNLYLELDLL